jgi:UDP-glucose:glycoprotein glucosyltransferase
MNYKVRKWKTFCSTATIYSHPRSLVALGYKATHFIASSADPLRTMSQLAQNFPKYATAIARRVTLTEDFKYELMGNNFLVQGGLNAIWFNGGNSPIADITPLRYVITVHTLFNETQSTTNSLLRLIRKERATVLSLTSLGLSPSQAVDLLTHPTIAEAQTQEGPKGLDGFTDASDRQEGGRLILWLNDIVRDDRYVI